MQNQRAMEERNREPMIFSGGRDKDESLRYIAGSPDLLRYYRLVISVLTSRYTASETVGSGVVDMKRDNKYKNIAKIGEEAASLIPIAGRAIGEAIGVAAEVADEVDHLKEEDALLKLKYTFPNPKRFFEIADEIAIQLTIAHERDIIALNGREAGEDFIKTAKGGEDKLLRKYILNEKIKTVAELKGHHEAHRIICFLVRKETSEEYSKEIFMPSAELAENICKNYHEGNKRKNNNGNTGASKQTKANKCCITM